MPEISVIVPVYRVEAYLKEALNSLLFQTFQNFEAILVDDGSPDNCPQILDEYEKKDKRISVIHQKNQGVSVARNEGLKKATGKYIFFMDSDDTIAPDFFEQIYKITNKNPDIILLRPKEDQTPYDLIGCCQMWKMVIKKEIFEQYPDIRFPNGLQPCEDGIVSNELLCVCSNIAECHEAMYHYRQNENSSEHTLKTDKLSRDIPKWFQIIEEFYTNHQLFQIKKYQILSFIMHEPFYRYRHFDFSKNQRKQLYKVMKEFIKRNNLAPLADKHFSKSFRNFVKSKSFFTYDFKRQMNSLFKLLFKQH